MPKTSVRRNILWFLSWGFVLGLCILIIFIDVFLWETKVITIISAIIAIVSMVLNLHKKIEENKLKEKEEGEK